MHVTRGIVAAAALVLLPACLSSRPRIPPGVDPDHLHFHEAKAAVGAPAPDFDLATADGRERVALSDKRGSPVVLVFGSYT